MPFSTERRLLQLAVFLGGFVPVLAGLSGMLNGAGLLHEVTSSALDSHIRYLSGLLFAIGIAFWSTIPRIEHATARIRLLTLIVFAGGLARLSAILFIAVPPNSMLLATIMELFVTPALCLWQSRIARLAKA